MKTNAKKAIVYLVTAIATALGILFGLSSCQVVRTISTDAKTVTRGDTVINISTRTVESYMGQKKNP
jgi:hypothetical protein